MRTRPTTFPSASGVAAASRRGQGLCGGNEGTVGPRRAGREPVRVRGPAAEAVAAEDDHLLGLAGRHHAEPLGRRDRRRGEARLPRRRAGGERMAATWQRDSQGMETARSRGESRGRSMLRGSSVRALVRQPLSGSNLLASEERKLRETGRSGTMGRGLLWMERHRCADAKRAAGVPCGRARPVGPTSGADSGAESGLTDPARAV